MGRPGFHPRLKFLILFMDIFMVSCEQKASLSFVIDNTFSMDDDISQVRDSTDKITKAVFDEKASQIENMVLVTFNDPDTHLAAVTKSRSRFKTAISRVHAYGGGDCPEKSLTGIIQALEHSLPGSFLYVFTDAAAKDYKRSKEVKNLCQKKQSQIMFVLTGFCKRSGPTHPNFRVYYDIATACSGLAISVDKPNVNQIIDSIIIDTIKGKKAVIKSVKTPANEDTIVPFEIDDQTEYATITASGSNVALSVNALHATQETPTWLPNVKAIKLINPPPGNYTATVRGSTETSVYIVGRTDFIFKHGFSNLVPKTINDTTPQPFADTSTHLSISVTDPKQQVQIQFAQLLDENDKPLLLRIPLTRIAQDFYVTTPFKAPSVRFRVAVHGKVAHTGADITRKNNILITPPDPPKAKIKSKVPVVTISEGKSTKVDYGETMKLTCKVSAYPRPKIVWSNSNGDQLTSESALIEEPYEYISYVTVTDFTKNDKYSCKASNNVGKNVMAIDVNTKDPFTVTSVPKGVSELLYGVKGTLRCDITAAGPMKINWYFVDKITGASKQLTTSDKYNITDNGKTLIINRMGLDMVGKYTCKAVLNKHENKFSVHETQVQITGLVAPNIISSSSIYNSVEGINQELKIPCKATGIPKPVITWKLNGKIITSGTKYLIGDGTLVIKDPKVTDSGLYTCEAQNDADTANAKFRAEIRQMPEISGENAVTAIKGSPVNIKCEVVKGVPKPIISWQFKAKAASTFESLSVYKDEMRIPSVGVQNAGSYKCVAHNVVGDAEHITLLTVQVPPTINPNPAIYEAVETRDRVLRINCKASGFPEPVITWKVKGAIITPNTKFSIEEKTLVIKEPVVADSGTYLCEAQNNADIARAMFRAEIRQLPAVSADDAKIAIKGHSVTLECKAVKGVPKPKISWQFKSNSDSVFKPMSIFDDILHIANVGGKNAGSYKCVAHNIVGDAEHITTLSVHVAPTIIASHSVYTAVETRDRVLRIPCKVTGIPKPNITWKIKSEVLSSSTKFAIEDGTLVIKNPKVTDSKTYTCEAQNAVDTVTAAFRADIHQLPEVYAGNKNIAIKGQPFDLKCETRNGVPKPTISWQFKSKAASTFETLSVYKEVLHIPNIGLEHEGTYKCVAHNEVGDGEHITTLTVQVAPNIIASQSVYDAVETRDRELRIPCRATGVPKPTITWKVKGDVIFLNAKYAIEDGTLVIREPKVEDSDRYTCEAQNEVDTITTTFQVNINQLPELSGVNDMIANKNQPVDIECRVTKGVPEPTLSWQFKPKGSWTFVELRTRDNVLRIPHAGVENSGTYKCIAHNIVGRVEHITTLTIHVAPNIISNPSRYEAVETRDRVLRIPCKASGIPKPNITWKVKGAIITSNTKFTVEDGTLVIREPKVTDSDTFTCEAQNEVDTARAVFRAEIRQLPEVSTEDEIIVTKGLPVNFECQVVKGVPEPTISWEYKRNAESLFEPLRVYSKVLQIPNVGVHHAGSYKCVAHNVVGDAEHSTTLSVQVPPSIVVSPSVFEGVESRDSVLTIPCKATGVPKPLITWKAKDAIIASNTKYSIEDGNLIIKDPQVTDSGTYTCEAQNVVAAVNATFRADIKQLPVISGDNEKIAVKGRPINLICKVLKGVPTPKISWKFKSNADSEFEVMSENRALLHIPNVGVEHAGSYKCLAHNAVGDSEHITTLIVLVPPTITANPSVYTAVEMRDRVLRIPCKATGLPKPTISWKVNNAVISSNRKFSIEEDTLVIKEPKVADSESYTCEAINSAGSVQAIFRANIYQLPEAFGTNEKIVIKSESVSLDCKALKGVPKPTISWQFKRIDASTYELLPEYNDVLRIPHVSVEHAGSYKCVAHNVVGNAEHITTLTVQVPPTINAIPSVYEGVEERDRWLRIPCQATGLPEPIITWKVKEAVIPRNNTKFAIEDRTLVIKDPKVADSGIYTCEAQNEANTAIAMFRAIIRQLPEVYTEDTKIIIKGQPIKIECEILKGVPEPTISWQFKPDSASNFEPLPGHANMLRISIAGVRHTGKYKCVAHNIVGDGEHITTVSVFVKPTIISSPSVYKAVEEKDRLLKIPCKTIGFPKPIITWKVKGAVIYSNDTFSIKNGTLVIKEPKVTDTHNYICEARNGAGTTHATFQINILQAPEVSGDPVVTVRKGHFTNIECKVIKGVPKPQITWQFQAESGSTFVSLHKTGAVLSILTVGGVHAGRYKCIAVNDLGHDEHVTELVVEFAPAIMSNGTTIYGMIGDAFLRIPCDAVGVPKPVITWKLDDITITPNTRYKVINGSLFIRKPIESDSNFYTCEAKNHLGVVYETFKVSVSSELEDFGRIREVNVLEGTTFNLECGSDDPSQSVKWYKEQLYTGVKGRYYHFKKIPLSLEGNYTCHVNDRKGARTETTVVIVGFKPRFENSQEEPLVEWSGTDINDELDCSFSAKPPAEVVWSFNGRVLSQNSSDLTVPGDWGHYTCNVSNIHGAIQRSFDVISTVCLINRKPKNIDTMPIIVSQAYTWPVLDSTADYLIVEPDSTIIFSCPDLEDQINSLQNTLGTNEVSATCVNQDVFKVDDIVYRVSDFQCAQPVNYLVLNKHKKCLGDTTEVMRVGFEVHGFLEIYEICFDVSMNIALYGRAVMSKSNRGDSHPYRWFKDPAGASASGETEYSCTNLTSSCCYTKTQLVNARDVSDGPPQKSTFIDPLNAVPLWLPCTGVNGQTPWASIEDTVRSRLDSYDQFVVWSGTHNIRNIKGVAIPRFLWKVVRFAEDDTLAMIYVNGPSPTEADILCTNVCADSAIVPWIHEHDDHTYCCEVNDFLRAFSLTDTSVGEQLESALAKIEAHT